MNLYIVTLQNYKEYYVIARDANKAYEKVRTILDRENLCFSSERQLKTIELLGENFYDSKDVFKEIN